jgi:D-galactarolactone cycloisomerase
MGRLMEAHQVEFFQEPVPSEDREGYRKARRENPVAVAGASASSRATASGI